MTRPLKSQWDFKDELFPTETYRQVLSVGELTLKIRRLLEDKIGDVWVTGEITNFRLQSSGHSYFAIKDAAAQLSCVLFRGDARSIERSLLTDGQKVTLRGELTVYEPRGQYQLRVLAAELQGIGALQAAFEKLKQKLGAEGLFDQERKRPLPRYPRHIGLVTSATGAALRDVLHVIERRFSGLRITLGACRVQGQGAAAEIACAIDLLNEWSMGAGTGRGPEEPMDLILITRGGGSLEDLWAFNEEDVARAIFRSELPIISAVGHEIDFTIADFVADVRAATPSAAAEIITEGYVASRQQVMECRRKLLRTTMAELDRKGLEAKHLAERLARAHPARRIQQQGQRLDETLEGLRRCVRVQMKTQRTSCRELIQRLVRLKPGKALQRRRERLEELNEDLALTATNAVKERRLRLEKLFQRLELLSPMSVLKRGYSITTDGETGEVIRRAGQTRPGQRLRTRISDGEVTSEVCESNATSEAPGANERKE